MFKTSINHRLLLLFCCLVGFFIVIQWQTPLAHAAGPTVSITQPSVNGNAVGHVGTKIHIIGSGFIAGSGFTPGTAVNLYTTADPAKCTATGFPGLLPLTLPTTTLQADGTFALDTTWPDNAAIATTNYYICVTTPAGVTPMATALSTNTFTVAPLQTISIAPPNAAPGGQVSITGVNWLPPQMITVAIVPATGTGVIVSQNVNSDINGNFNAALTIPANTPPGTYSVSVIAENETTLQVVENNAITVAAATPTPTVAPTPTPSPHITATATPSTNTSNNGSGGGTFLVFALAGAGVLLVIVGIILFVIYSRSKS